jgi:nucleoside-diphosphate-sugar epimerase
VCEEARIRPTGSEVNRLIADNTLIKSLTGWTPQTDFRQGLEHTVEWIRRNLGLFNPVIYSV